MNTRHTPVAVILALALLLAFSGCAMAAMVVKATPETQGVRTSTAISVASGSVSTSVSSTMIVGTAAAGINNPPLGAGEAQVINGYTEFSDFSNGATEYKRDISADTGNKVLGQNNYQAHRNIQYVAQTNAAGLTGTAETSERIFMDLVGASSDASESMLCPFAGSGEGSAPAFCTIVQAGSTVIGTQIGSLITDANLRDIGATADFPAELGYTINAKNVIGSVNAFMDVHAQDGRPDSDTKQADFVYKESDTATGFINSFSKSMYYQDGLLRI
jgi:hypothetical protein